MKGRKLSEALGSAEQCEKNEYEKNFCEKACRDIKLDEIVQGDSIDLLKCLPSDSIDLVVTSPPYADRRKSSYGGVSPDEYVEWFEPFSEEIKRVLKPSGSFALNINDIAVDGQRHPYVYELVLDMQKKGWRWVDTFIWKKENPVPGRWNNRFKDGFEYIYHFAKEKGFTFNPDAVRMPVKESTVERLSRLRKNDFSRRESASGSGFGVTMANFGIETALPSNVISSPTTAYNRGHSAAFPEAIPEFFIKALSDEGDVVLDPFIGSGTTALSAKKYCRNFVGFDKEGDFVSLSKERVGKVPRPECM